MVKTVLTNLFVLLLILAGFYVIGKGPENKNTNGAPPYAIEDLQPPDNELGWIYNWERPDGPPRVALQVGHLKNNELPEELERLRGNTGSRGGGRTETEVNLTIAETTRDILTEKGIEVDILPATIPPRYWADAFVAIHADGSTDTSKSGYKIATPRRDFSGNADKLLQNINSVYKERTGFVQDPNVTKNMTGYYAFAWWRYVHSLHPKTAAVILETGFLTNPGDRKIIVDKPEVSASALAQGLIDYLRSQELY